MNDRVVTVCEYGVRSGDLAAALRRGGVPAIVLSLDAAHWNPDTYQEGLNAVSHASVVALFYQGRKYTQELQAIRDSGVPIIPGDSAYALLGELLGRK